MDSVGDDGEAMLEDVEIESFGGVADGAEGDVEAPVVPSVVAPPAVAFPEFGGSDSNMFAVAEAAALAGVTFHLHQLRPR